MELRSLAVEELKEAIDAHAEWLEAWRMLPSDRRKRGYTELWQDPRRLVLRSTRINQDHASIPLSDLACADILDCRFEGLSIENVCFDDVEFSGTVLEDVRIWGGSAKRSILRKSEFHLCKLWSLDFSNSSWVEVNAFQTEMLECNHACAEWLLVKFENGSLEGSLLKGIVAKQLALEKCNLDHACLENAQVTCLGEAWNNVTARHTILDAAICRGVHLSDSDISAVSLRETQLSDCTFDRCEARGIDMSFAKLARVQFERCDLSSSLGIASATLLNVRFDNASGLFGHELRGADLSGTSVPAAAAGFEALSRANDAAKLAQQSFLVLVGACAFGVISLYDVRRGGSPTSGSQSALIKIPILDAELHQDVFFFIWPWLVAIFFAYFHLYLFRFWRELANLPTIFPDGRAVDSHAYPWIFTSLVRVWIPRLKQRLTPGGSHRLMHFVESSICVLTGWLMGPATVLILAHFATEPYLKILGFALAGIMATSGALLFKSARRLFVAL